MSQSVAKFNALNGTVATREQLEKILEIAKNEEQNHIILRLEKALKQVDKKAEIELSENAIECIPASMLNGLQFDDINEDLTGLGKSLTQNDIYDLITEKILERMKKATGKDYVRKWKNNVIINKDGSAVTGYMIPMNFVTKKAYTGINFLMLANFDDDGFLQPMENPYFMTFKQVQEKKGKVKKGATASEVIYFSFLYSINDTEKNLKFKTNDQAKFVEFINENNVLQRYGLDSGYLGSFLSQHRIPILRYYNVFNGNDIEGIDFKLNDIQQGKVLPEIKATKDNPNEKIEVAEKIINNYPPKQPRLKFGGNKAFFSPFEDLVQMPYFQAFETAQDYYRTLFHEFSHSTGIEKRLNRDQSGSFGSKPYALEELVAEISAIFLSAEAGIIWHNNRNHEEYLKNWSQVLEKSKEDNKFIFKATSLAKKSAEFILQRNEAGYPKYLIEIEEEKEIEKVATKNKVATNNPKEPLKTKKKTAKINPKKINKTVEKPTKEAKKEVKPIVEPVENNYPFSKDDVPYETARRAYYWTSMTPEKRAEMEQKNYFETMQEVYDKYLPVATEKDLKEKFLNLFDKFNKGYLKLKLSELSARSNTASTMVTGGSNFNVSKNQKALNRHKAKLDELYSFSDKYQKYFKDLLFPEAKPIKSGKEGTLQRLEEKLLKLEENQEKMVKANAEIRKLKKKGLSNSELIAEYEKYLASVGFSSKEIESTVSISKRENNLIWLPFGTTNSSAEIRRLKQRIEQEKKLKQKAEIKGNSDKVNFDGGYIFNDYSENRLKIHFDEKPSEEVRSFLKKSGQNFKWSPFNKVWQRQLNTYYKGNKEDLFKFLNIETEKKQAVKVDSNGQTSLFGVKKVTPKKSSKIQKIGLAGNNQESEFFSVSGEVGKFLQQVERKPFESVVITMDGEQGAGKTTTLYKFMDSFAVTGNKCLFLSLEEHPASSLAKDKVSKYLSSQSQDNIDTVGEVESVQELYDFIADYDIIFIDSWQKLLRMVGSIRLDEDLRKKFNGKVFVVIFQQTTTGRTKGGAEVVFDGDIIIKMVKEKSFAENYAYFDKNRYTLIPIENIRYNIASGTCYNPNEQLQPVATETKQEEIEIPTDEINLSFEIN